MRLLLACYAILAVWHTGVFAASSGNLALCDAINKNFGVGGALMPWATPPVRSANYSVRSGDGPRDQDVTTWTPGEYTTIHVRVLHPDAKFRGMLLYAVAYGNETRVGTWEFPVNVTGLEFWNPPICGPQLAVAHTDANEKHYHNAFRFRNPPAGTGTLIFRALVKVGPANTGSFFHPMLGGDLVLHETAPNTRPIRRWVRGGLGQSCDQVCPAADPRYTCDLQGMLAANSADLIDASISSNFTCQKPYLSLCTSYSPSSSSDGWCWYYHKNCGCLDSIAGCQNTPPTCDSFSTNPADGYRLCSCFDAPAVAAQAASAASAKQAKETGTIAGAVVGGAVGGVVVIAGLILFCKMAAAKSTTKKMSSEVSM